MSTIFNFFLSLVIASVSCQHQHFLHIDIDDFLNTKVALFPNQTIEHHHNLEDQTLENFKLLLEDDDAVDRAYERFKAKFGEKHTPLEFHHHGPRRDVFKENLIFVFHHNLLARMKLHSTFEMGMNKFADMYLDEFKRERLGLIIPDDYHSNDLPHFNMSESNYRNVPSYHDWRDFEMISPVKDQAKCGACVMFSMTSSIEGHHAISRGREILDFSEQFMIDCAVRENGYNKNRGCEGNTFPDSLKFAKDYGMIPEHLYPYQGKQGKCQFEGMHPITQLKDYRRLPDKTDDVKYSVANEGPASMGIYVWRQFLLYAGGVYNYCSFPSSAVGGHAMSIIGYKEEGKYYIIKNEWGIDWGENGYVRYSYTDPRCGLEKLAYTFYV